VELARIAMAKTMAEIFFMAIFLRRIRIKVRATITL
jgi:hypothetical protein